MTQPKTNFPEQSYEVCLEILDTITPSSGRGGQYPVFGLDIKPGQVIYEIANMTGYNYHTVLNAIKTMESYRMVAVTRLSHPYPCQHNFVVGIKRLGVKNWTAEPVNLWGSVQPRPTSTGRAPKLTVIHGGIAS